ncbi:MAG: hypothetical protein ACJ789_19245 [Thermomicrobiales bacterium]
MAAIAVDAILIVVATEFPRRPAALAAPADLLLFAAHVVLETDGGVMEALAATAGLTAGSRWRAPGIAANAGAKGRPEFTEILSRAASSVNAVCSRDARLVTGTRREASAGHRVAGERRAIRVSPGGGARARLAGLARVGRIVHAAGVERAVDAAAALAALRRRASSCLADKAVAALGILGAFRLGQRGSRLAGVVGVGTAPGAGQSERRQEAAAHAFKQGAAGRARGHATRNLIKPATVQGISSTTRERQLQSCSCGQVSVM